jgi:hypothetical protein
MEEPVKAWGMNIKRSWGVFLFVLKSSRLALVGKGPYDQIWPDWANWHSGRLCGNDLSRIGLSPSAIRSGRTTMQFDR